MDNGVIVLVGNDFDSNAVGVVLESNFTDLKYLKKYSTSKNFQGNLNVVTRDELRDLAPDLVTLNERDGEYYAIKAGDLQDNKNVVVVFAEECEVKDVLSFIKKSGDVPYVAFIEGKASTAEKELFIGRLQNIGVAIQGSYGKHEADVEKSIYNDAKDFLKKALSVPDIKALREKHIGPDFLSATREFDELDKNNEIERKIKNHLYGTLAAATVAAVTGGAGIALATLMFGKTASHLRRAKLADNQNPNADGLSLKDMLLYHCFSGLASDAHPENITSKKDLDQAIQRFRSIKHENDTAFGFLDKLILAAGDKITELSITLNGISEIRDNHMKQVVSDAGITTKAFSNNSLPQTKDFDFFAPPVETGEIFKNRSAMGRI